MSGGEVPKVSREAIQQVQNLIEGCIQLHMSRKEVVNTLLDQAKIEPDFTELVWQKLEEENREFFNAYYLRLLVKDQIMQFNRLLARQEELMRQVASVPMSNGPHIPQLHQNSGCYASGRTGPAMKAESIMHQQPIGSNLPNIFPDAGSSLNQCIENPVDMSTHARRIDVSPNMLLAQSSNVGMIKLEGAYPGSSPYMFCSTDGNVLEARPPITDASLSSFSSIESNSQPLNEALFDAPSSGFLGHIPRNSSLSDLTADFPNSSDILGSYFRLPFPGADSDCLDPHGMGEHRGDN